MRCLAQTERAAIALDITRVSRKLHLRRYRYTIGPVPGLVLEAWAAILGGFLIAYGIADRSNLAAILGMLIWVTCFEPLLKVAVGSAFGVEYDYVYLYGGAEPRFKMKFGSYLAIAPLKRSLLHFSGAIGSPLAALLAAGLTADLLPVAHVVSWIVFAVVVAMNLGALVAALAGVRRVGGVRLPEGSPTMGLDELRFWARSRQ